MPILPPCWSPPGPGEGGVSSPSPPGGLPIRQAAKRWGRSEAAVRIWCRTEGKPKGLAWLGPPPGGRGRPCWWISRDADPRLAAQPDAIARDYRTDLSKYRARFVERGQQRLRWVRRYLDLCPTLGEARAARRVVAEAKAETPGLRISLGSLRRWHRRWREGGLEALIDRYPPGNGSTRGPDAMAYFYSLYRSEKQLSIVYCHEQTLGFAQARGLAWPESVRATQAWLQASDDLSTSCLMRQGYEVWAHRFMPHIEQDHDAVAPGAMYVGDSHRCNFFCRDVRGKARRPWLIALQDDNTRCIVGWCLTLSANQDTILLAVRQALLGWAIPHVLKLDNGRDYRAQLFHGKRKPVLCDRPEWKGLLPELGIRVIFAGAYEPQAKPAMERWFGTANDRLARTLPGYCGRSADERTNAMETQRQDVASLLTLAEARDRLRVWIDQEYHQRPHSGLGGISPREKWSQGAESLRKADAAALDLLLQVRGLRKVGPNGVTLSFGGAAIRYGQWDTTLRRYAGRDVLVACDPQDAGSVVCLDAKTRQVICRAPANKRVPPNVTGEDFRESFRQRARAKRVARSAQASAPDRLRSVEQICTEKYRRQAMVATGTDHAAPHAPDLAGFEAVRTGFEGATSVARTIVEPPPPDDDDGPIDLSDWIDDDDNGVPPGIGGAGTNEDHCEMELDGEPQTTGLEDWE